MQKSAINVLQEYSIIHYKRYPTYHISDTSTGSSPLFTVQCEIGNVRSAGIASSKIVAKTEAAEQMIRKLGLANINNPVSPGTPVFQSPSSMNQNYIGALNELCSKNSQPYPTYNEGMQEGRFLSICIHQGLKAQGVGTNKKLAKQESAKAMFELCNNKSKSFITNSHTNLIDLDISSLSLQHSREPSPSSTQIFMTPKSKVQKESLFVPCVANANDSVSILNLYCDKFKYKKPDYHDCGKEGTTYLTKCLYQSFMTKGTGLTTKFAKQESARLMLEMIGINPSSKSSIKEVNLIDINDNLATPIRPIQVPHTSKVIISPSIANPLSDKELIEIYKKNAPELKEKKSNILHDFDAFYNDLENSNNATSSCEDEESFSHFKKILIDKRVKYKINVLQTHNPRILTFEGSKLMDDGEIVTKNFMEMGDLHKEIVGNLLKKAITAF